jgi:sugar lactone lactonase YvrE
MTPPVRNPRRRRILVALALALTGCQTPVSLHQIKQPLFTLGAEASGVVTPAGGSASAGRSGALTVSIQGALAGLRKRSVLATVADVERVTVSVQVGGDTVSRTVERAALAAGQTSVTFTGLPVGTATVTVTAYDVADQVLGATTQSVSIVAGQGTTADIALQLAPVTAPTGGGGSTPATSGDLSANVQIFDSPIMKQPLPAAGSVYTLDFSPLSLVVDKNGDVWLGGVYLTNQGQAKGRLVKLSPTGQELVRKEFDTTVTSVAIDTTDWVVVADTADAMAGSTNQSGMLSWFYLDGTYEGETMLTPGSKSLATTSLGGIFSANLFENAIWVYNANFATMDFVGYRQEPGPFAMADARNGEYVVSGGSLERFNAQHQRLSRLEIPDFACGALAIDAAGNYWVIGKEAGQGLKKISPAGAVLASAPAIAPSLTSPVMPFAERIAFDAAGGAWVANEDELVQFFPNGLVAGSYAMPTGAKGVAAGSSGVWVIDGDNRVYRVAP